MQSVATKHYCKSSYTFCHNPVSAPALFFYSRTDPVGTAESNERFMDSLKRNMGYDNVRSKAFEDSPHVSHMYKHPDEYMSTLKGFLSGIEYFQEALAENRELSDFVGEEDKDEKVKVAEDEKRTNDFNLSTPRAWAVEGALFWDHCLIGREISLDGRMYVLFGYCCH